MTLYHDTTLANLTQKINRRLMRKIIPTMILEFQHNHQTGFGYYIRTASVPGEQSIWGPYRHDQLIALALYCGAIRKPRGPTPTYRLLAGSNGNKLIEPKTLGLPHDLKFPFKTHVLQDAQDAIRNSLGPTQPDPVTPSEDELPEATDEQLEAVANDNTGTEQEMLEATDEQLEAVTAPVTEDSTGGGV